MPHVLRHQQLLGRRGRTFRKKLSYPILEMSRPDDKESRPFMSYTLNASATPIFIQRFAEDQIKAPA